MLAKNDTLQRQSAAAHFRVDVSTKQVRQLTQGDTDEHSIDWSPDGKEILLLQIVSRIKTSSSITTFCFEGCGQQHRA